MEGRDFLSICAEFKSPDEVPAIYHGYNVESSMLSVAVRNSQTSVEVSSEDLFMYMRGFL